jgi:hypothetical protein
MSERMRSFQATMPYSPACVPEAPVPGKAALTDQLFTMGRATPSAVSRVKARKGESFRDGDETYKVLADASFRKTWPEPQRVIKPIGEDAAEWTRLAGVLARWDGTRASEGEGHTADAPVQAPRKPTLGPDPLANAETRAALGDTGTHYSRGNGALNQGRPDETTFFCSGLQVWALAAAGYDMRGPIKGRDGRPFTYTVANAGVFSEKEINLKQLIDGEPEAVEAMILVEQLGMSKGGSVGFLSGTGHRTGHRADGGAYRAVKGAAGAFELAHLGREVSEREQKPGDFAQERRTQRADLGHDGAGHAWLVQSVVARGAAMFGEPGSPECTNRSLAGWHEDVEFVINAHTRPELVGAHVVTAATRLEANEPGNQGLAAGGDGGVHVTTPQKVGAHASAMTDAVTYVGRLATSPWERWRPAVNPERKTGAGD